MIGKGRFRELSTGDRLTSAARQFSDALFARSRCRLAWHRTRNVHVVYQDRGDHVPPQSFFDIRRDQLPFTSNLLHQCATMIEFYRAQMNGDTVRMMDTLNRDMKDKAQRELNRFEDDYRPEFMRDMARFEELLDGAGQKYFSMAS